MQKLISIIIALSFTMLGANQPHLPEITKETPVSEALNLLGESRPDHYLQEVDQEMIDRGEELVKLGRTTGPDLQRTQYISKYYTCTSCHNIVREDKNLAVVNQEARLEYAISSKIPYLQGSTFWGIVNKESWYNDDYIEKYGSLVYEAQKSLAESVKLCATVCSQGRELKDWELESILAYMWSLEMKMKDLSLSDDEWSNINSEKLTEEQRIELIKSTYLQKSPATFVEPPENKKKGYPYDGEPDLGKAIYELGCQHCHRPGGESDVVFDQSSLTLNWLKRHIPDDSEKSIYEIIRHGTYAAYGHKEYMPHYTLEKMSDQQVEHLRAYIETGNR